MSPLTGLRVNWNDIAINITPLRGWNTDTNLTSFLATAYCLLPSA